MAVKGVFASDQNIAGTEKGSFASAILQLYPTGTSPLLGLSSGMQSSDESSTIITWFEENHLNGYLTTANNPGTGTSIDLGSDISQIVAGAVMLNQASGEYILVESVSGNIATVKRGLGGSSVVAIGLAAKLQRISAAHEEGSSRPNAIANIGYPRFNYMHIFRNSWSATATAKAVQYHTGDVVAKNRADAGMFHAEDIERALLWSKQSVGVMNNQPFRTMDGIVNQITTNVSAQGANTTWADINTFLQTIFERNIKGKPNERIAFCGNTVLSVLNEISKLSSQINIVPGETEFGLKINKWLTPFGDISLMTHPLMNENPVWTKEMYVLHPGAIKVKYLRRTNHDADDKNGSRQGVDADSGVYTTECSVEYGAELTGGIYTGIDTAA
ncbi:MAG TPA: hypothetical protein ENJ28_04925 [Gammaproteobacteria bacterium]|nr:hypothetical protein [Gammaproteobacteria bacterium]